MLSVAPSNWDSVLEDPSRQSSLFISTEDQVVAHLDTGLQYAALSRDIFASDDNLPIIDEALFDVPELEIVDFVPSPLSDFLADVPPLEDEWIDDHILEDLAAINQDHLKVVTKDILFKEPVVNFEQPSVPTSKPLPIVVSNGFEEMAVANEEIIASTPNYVDSCRSESPMSCYSATSDESHDSEKRRRVSQVSISSYCSSAGESLWSPSSDSEADSKRSGRRSKFTAEDRKERKKAQNRSAAEKYRQKRKVQEETITEEEQILIDGNTELKTEVTKIRAEVSCLRQLLRDMLQAKGLSIPPPKKKKITT